MRVTTWDEVLAEVESLPPSAYFCFPDAPVHGGERVGVADDADELGPDENLPAEAVALGLTRSLEVEAVRQVRDNLRAQGAASDLPKLRHAVAHYIDHDAFLEVAGRARLPAEDKEFAELHLPPGLPVDRDEVEDLLVERLGLDVVGAGTGDLGANLDLELTSGWSPDRLRSQVAALLAELGVSGARLRVEGDERWHPLG